MGITETPGGGMFTTRVVYIDAVEKFPTPVGGIITLENATYIITNNIQTDLTFKAPTSGYCLLESAGNQYELQYTGTGAMFDDDNMTGNYTFHLLQLSAPNGKLFDLVGTGENEVLMIDSTVYDVADIGTIKDMSSSFNFCLFLLWGQGLIIDGTSCYMEGSAIADGYNESDAVMLTIQGVIRSIVISNNGFTTNGANERILDIKSTGTYDEGNVNINRFSVELGGEVYASGSLDHKYPFFDFVGNTGKEIVNSSVACAATLEDNALETDIPAQDALVFINATGWFCNQDSVETERIVIDSAGLAEYTGLSKVNIKLDGNIAPDPATSTKNISTEFVKIHSHESFTVTFTNATNIVNEIGTALVNGDTISFYDTAGTLPTGLRKDIIYYVVNKLTDSFQLSYTLGGTAITFTNDGTPVNSYSEAQLVGSNPQQAIAAGTPRDLVPQAIVTVEQGDKVGCQVKNLTDAVNIGCTNAFYRISK